MKLWNSMVFPRKLSTNCWVSTSMLIRRPLPSLSLGGAAPRDHRRCAAWPCACFVLCHDGTSRDPTSCFYWASKLLRGTFSATSRGPTTCFDWASTLLRGTFWAPLKSFKSLKSPAATFEGLWTAKPSAAACETAYVALFWTPLKSIKSLKSHTSSFRLAFEP